MPFAPTDTDIARWITTKCKAECPSCGTTEGVALKDPFSIPPMPESGIPADQSLALVPVMCTHCGHVRLFSFTHIALELSAS